MISISLVPTEGIEPIWTIVAPMLNKAIRYSSPRYRLVDILADLYDGKQTLWIAIENGLIIGCTTISITRYPSGVSALCYEHLGGKDISKWIDEGHRVCSAYAREFGCSILECQGRSGWKPFLEKLGYKQFAVKYQCNLEDLT